MGRRTVLRRQFGFFPDYITWSSHLSNKSHNANTLKQLFRRLTNKSCLSIRRKWPKARKAHLDDEEGCSRLLVAVCW